MRLIPTLLRDGRLIAHNLPLTVAANPDPGVTVGSAEILAKLVAFHVGASRDHGGIAIHPHHHVRNIHGFIAELSAPASGDCLLFRGDLSEWGYRYIVVGKAVQRKVRITTEAGLLRLAFHIDDLANDLLLCGTEAGSGMNRNVLSGKCRQGHKQAT